MSGFRGQERLRVDIRPTIADVMEFSEPTGGTPALLGLDADPKLFHEFGNVLHGLLSDATYPCLAATSVDRDFVELPGQVFEHWLEVPEVPERFARHHRTGESMPASLVQRLKAARNADQGFVTVEYMACAPGRSRP